MGIDQNERRRKLVRWMAERNRAKVGAGRTALLFDEIAEHLTCMSSISDNLRKKGNHGA